MHTTDCLERVDIMNGYNWPITLYQFIQTKSMFHIFNSFKRKLKPVMLLTQQTITATTINTTLAYAAEIKTQDIASRMKTDQIFLGKFFISPTFVPYLLF